MSFELDCMKYSARYFEFKTDSALSDVGFSQYSLLKLKVLKNRLNTDSVVQRVKAGHLHSVNFAEDEKYFAHLMFNSGVVTTKGCFGTSVRYYSSVSRCKE